MTEWIFGLSNFVQLFSYLPPDIATFLLAAMMCLVILAFRRILY